jgi:NAD(P)-dependent dehydrogenase (short-subunit alcohol dehydrogenase family)
MRELRLRGEVALVTGGAGTIGNALGRALERCGATVVSCDLQGGQVVAGSSEPVVELDVTDREAFARVVREVRERHGSVDILVNNAGVGCGGEAHDVPGAQWDLSLDVNLRGAVNGILAAYPAMIERRKGRIVNVASLAGLLPLPLLVPYAMSKSGLVGLSTSLRIEAALYDVKVSVACPGPVDTPFLDTGGVGGSTTTGLDARRYLTASAGPPLTPDAFAAAVVGGMASNRAVITPGRARVLWGLSRFAPRLTARVIAGNMRKELAHG